VEHESGGGQASLFRVDQKGWKGAATAREVGASMSCGSVWFVDAGRMSFIETPISSRYLSPDDRIEIADGLARRAGQGDRQ